MSCMLTCKSLFVVCESLFVTTIMSVFHLMMKNWLLADLLTYLLAYLLTYELRSIWWRVRLSIDYRWSYTCWTSRLLKGEECNTYTNVSTPLCSLLILAVFDGTSTYILLHAVVWNYRAIGSRDAAGRTLILIRCSNPAWTTDNAPHLTDLLSHFFSSCLSFSYVCVFFSIYISKNEIIIFQLVLVLWFCVFWYFMFFCSINFQLIFCVCLFMLCVFIGR